jgi:hypothetical protein
MNRVARKIEFTVAVLSGLLLMSSPAEAFRCGNRIVQDGMHEDRVRALCGEPVSTRTVGLIVRSFHRRPQSIGNDNGNYYWPGYYDEVMVTELVYNFGPRKLMRVLRFEGGYLVDIRTAGYGYRTKD